LPVDPTDVRRAEKYDVLQGLLDEMRRAEIEGRRVYDEKN